VDLKVSNLFGVSSPKLCFALKTKFLLIPRQLCCEVVHEIFSLKTKTSENRFDVHLPLSEKLTTEIIERLKEQKAGFRLMMKSYMTNDYFEELENMILIKEYLKGKNIPDLKR